MNAHGARDRSGPDGGPEGLASLGDLTAIVMAAVAADMMRALQFTAVVAFRV
jgi:hypothetical protein